MTPSGPRVVHADVGIVGAGPGGLAAANALAQAGLRVVVLDEGQRPGGQIHRQLPLGAAPPPAAAEPPSHAHGHSLLHTFAAQRIDLRAGATVWDARPGRLWFEHDGASWLLLAERLLLAPGAYDRCVPFPGWTLPGVVTAGAVQVMVRGFAVAPGRRALVAGSGPLLLPTVTALTQAGVTVVAALEATSRWRTLRAAPAVLGNAARRREALWYAKQLWRSGVRLRFGHTVFACEGDGRVQRAVIGRVDADGRPLRATARTVEVDLVAAGFGLVPSVELALRLGCATRFDPIRGGHCVVVDQRQQSSVPGVFAVGEICGIGGGEVAAVEGELAAAAIVHARGGPAPAAALQRRARDERRSADAMLRVFAPLPGLVELADAATIVCRCEDVPLAAVRATAELHGRSTRAVKLGCRAGMGPCQGRICGPMMPALVAGDGRLPAELPVVQVPLKPVRTSTLVDAPQ